MVMMHIYHWIDIDDPSIISGSAAMGAGRSGHLDI
jgi:hypothetical protein